MNAIIDKWVAEGILKLFKSGQEPTLEDKQKPLYCCFHRYVHHWTKDCRTLRKMFHRKITDGTLDHTQ